MEDLSSKLIFLFFILFSTHDFGFCGDTCDPGDNSICSQEPTSKSSVYAKGRHVRGVFLAFLSILKFWCIHTKELIELLKQAYFSFCMQKGKRSLTKHGRKITIYSSCLDAFQWTVSLAMKKSGSDALPISYEFC